MIDLSSYNPLSMDVINNPFPYYKKLRETEPVCWHDDMEVWLLSSYQDCERVLRDHKSFARDLRRVGYEIPDHRLNVQTFDPPYLMELRKIIMKAYTKENMEIIANKVLDYMKTKVSTLPVGEVFNFAEEISYDVAMKLTHLVSGLAGVTVKEYHPIFTGLTRSMDSRLDESRSKDGEVAYKKFRAILDPWYESKSDDNIIAQLKANVDDGLPYKRDFILNTVSAIFNASYSSTEATMSSFMEVVVQNADKFRNLPADFDYENATQEILRFLSPAQATSRFAIEDCKIGDKEIAGGDMIVTLMASANRDPRVFESPDTLVIDRKFTRPHLAFGWGSHHCTGSDIASIWLTQYLKFLVQNLSLFQLAGPPQSMHTATLRSYTNMPVKLNHKFQ